jgi:hypothetical protein
MEATLMFFEIIFFLKSNKWICKISVVCVPLTPYQVLNQFADCYETWHERCAIEGHPKAAVICFPRMSNNMAETRTCFARQL